VKMAQRISSKVRGYCEVHGIVIPVGFDRHPASRYVIIEQTDPPRLVARTWFNQADVLYYLEHLADDTPRRIFDFQEGDELAIESGRLKRIGKLGSS
jgi:hypothetical protein